MKPQRSAYDALRAGPAERRAASRRSWDTVEPPRRFQALWVSLGILGLPAGLVATVLRLSPPYADAPALVAAFIPYGLLAYWWSLLWFAVAFFRASRRLTLGLLTLLCAGLLALHVSWLAPLFVPDGRPTTSRPFTVLSLNLKEGRAATEQVARRAADADVITLLEATPAAVRQLREIGEFARRFPYSVGHTASGVGGTVLFSRYPLTQRVRVPGSRYQQWLATTALPGVGPVRITAVHPCNPFCGHNAWATEHATLARTALANGAGPLVVAGDFNAVDDHGPMLALRRGGLRSATDLAGAGWLPTYPANSRVPPLVPIDHVLVNHRLTALSVSRFAVDGTDHLGLVAQLALSG